MFSIRSREGRLVEIRVTSLETVDEVELVGRQFLDTVAAIRQRRVIVCADYRPVKLLGPAVADKFREMMAGTNPRVERSAMLLPQPGTASLQIDRIARETRYPHRKTFREPAELETWLGEVLNPAERTRLRAFLAETD